MRGRWIVGALVLASACLSKNPDWEQGQGSGTTDTTTTDTTTTSSPTQTATTTTTTTTQATSTAATQTVSGGTTTVGSTTGLPNGRVEEGLTVLYLFDAGQGTRVDDVSGSAQPVDLEITGPVTWTAEGLSIGEDVILRSVDPVAPSRVASQEFTVEVWARPTSPMPGLNDGPRLVAFEDHDTGTTNFFVSAGSSIFALALASDDPALPSFHPISVNPDQIRHVAFTVATNGQVIGYENGVSELAVVTAPAPPSLWQANMPFVVANASDEAHAWRGDIALIALYDRALTPAEVRHNFEQGY